VTTAKQHDVSKAKPGYRNASVQMPERQIGNRFVQRRRAEVRFVTEIGQLLGQHSQRQDVVIECQVQFPTRKVHSRAFYTLQENRQLFEKPNTGTAVHVGKGECDFTHCGIAVSKQAIDKCIVIQKCKLVPVIAGRFQARLIAQLVIGVQTVLVEKHIDGPTPRATKRFAVFSHCRSAASVATVVAQFALGVDLVCGRCFHRRYMHPKPRDGKKKHRMDPRNPIVPRQTRTNISAIRPTCPERR
jgi:hypothetical protein